METKTLDYLPVKFQYSYHKQAIQMFYRKKHSHKLFNQYIPYQHYIFTRIQNPEDEEEGNVFIHLTNGKKYKKTYMDPKKARKEYREYEHDTAEGDVDPCQRFAVDAYKYIDFPGDIHPRIWFYDIETEIVGASLPSFQNNKADITAFTIYDTYTETYYCRYLVPRGRRNEDLDSIKKEIEDSLEEYDVRYDVKLFVDPKELVGDLIWFFVNMTPDIITSWNIPFDGPVTIRKVFDHFGEQGLKDISPFGRIAWHVKTCLEDGTEPYSSDELLPGISLIDDLALYKKMSDTEKVSYSLNSIAMLELNEGKLQYDTDFFTLYNENFVYFCKYNMQDVRVMVMLEKKLKLFDLVEGVRNLAKADYGCIFAESQSIDNLCLMKINRWRDNGKNWVLPSAPTVNIKEKYIGAYVKPTIKGRFKWIGDLDYKSMYPSSYVTWNLSNETIVGVIENRMEVVRRGFKNRFPELTDDEIEDTLLPGFPRERDTGYIRVKANPLYSHIQREFENYEEFKGWCLDNNYAIMGNGVIVDQNVEEPFLGSLAGEIMDLRDTYKVKMKEYDAAGNDIMARVFDISQKAVKTINNSIYGVTASGYFRLFDIKLAEAITATGQCIIKSSTYLVNKGMNQLMERINPSHTFRDIVITNDTDSIIFTVEDIVDDPITCTDVEKFKATVKKINIGQQIVNKKIKSIAKQVFFIKDTESERFRLYIKNEWLASTGFFLGKKGYALNIVFKEGYPKTQFEVKGLTLKKSSTPKAMRNFLATIVKMILNFSNKEDIDKTVLDEAIKLKTYSLEDIAVPTGVNGIDSYDKNPIHVRGSKVFNQYFAKSNKDKIISDKVKYLYVKNWLTEPKLNFEKEYVISIPTNKQEYWEMLPKIVEPDYPLIREKLIINPIKKMYEAMKWELPNIARADVWSCFDGLKKVKRKRKSEGGGN